MIRRHRKSLEDQIARVEARLAVLEHERGHLSRKLNDLCQQLRSETGVQDRADRQAPASIPQYPVPTTPDEKIALFMDRFQGRRDVYPKLWINRSKGRKGYSPACGNEWARGLCAKLDTKPKVKCGDCQHQAFLPVTKQVVRDHLQGRHVVGVYPMLADETCCFLAIDFDKAGWQNDVAAVAETCRNHAVPSAIERSRSGNGAHLWVFFSAPLPATTARKLGCFLLTETMARRHELPMTSYDRLFPNQDTLPKGGFGNLIALPFQHEPRQQGHSVFIDDQRTDGAALDVAFQGELTALQAQAAETMAVHDIGVLIAPPGSGKTVIGVNLLARRKRSTLVLVHRTQLLEQWVAQLAVFLGLTPSEIGQVGGGKRKPNGQLDVAMIQSLVSKESVDDLVARYGQVLVDECHHVPAVSFERVMREVKARLVIGLTATPQRRDGHHPILTLQLGPVRFAIDAKHQAAARPFEHRLILRETDFQLTDAGQDISIQEIYRQLAADDARNQMILPDVSQALSEGRSPILLTERRDHLARLAEQLTGVAKHLIVLQGGMKTKERQAAVQRLASIPASEPRLVIAIGKFIGEGFDDTRLDTLFLAMPFSWKGTLVQYVGRLHRRHEAKTEVRVIDYVDRQVPMLARMLDKRMQGYRSMGYRMMDDGGDDR